MASHPFTHIFWGTPHTSSGGTWVLRLQRALWGRGELLDVVMSLLLGTRRLGKGLWSTPPCWEQPAAVDARILTILEETLAHPNDQGWRQNQRCPGIGRQTALQIPPQDSLGLFPSLQASPQTLPKREAYQDVKGPL